MASGSSTAGVLSRNGRTSVTPDSQRVRGGLRFASLEETPRARPASVASHNHRGSVRSLETLEDGFNQENEASSQARGQTSSMFSEMKQLRTEQKKLQDTALRIEKMLQEIGNVEEHVVSKKSSIPRDLSALVHDVYAQIKDSDEIEWDYTVKFDDPENKDINKLLIQNITTVNDNCNANVSLIKRAMRTYFKTKKSREKRRLSGRDKAAGAESCKRQRRHNKAHARMKALQKSTTIHATIKQKVEKVLVADYMSSEESIVQDTDEDPHSSDESESDTPQSKKGRKRLIRHPLTWRSREFQDILESLDRKIARRRSARGKAMCLDVEIGSNSARPKPDSLPEWAAELFD